MRSIYLITLLRNFTRQKGYYALNILGLAIGIACFILIMLFISHERGYDRYNQNADRIYRIAVDAVDGNTLIYQTHTPAPLPPALYSEFPEIEKVVRITADDEVKVQYKDQFFTEDRVFLVDSTFFCIFSFEAIAGTLDDALSDPFSAVLTTSTAIKYFGTAEPVGRIMTFYDTIPFRVTAVVNDVPDQSHFHFDFLLSLTSFDGLYNGTSWWWNSFACYLLLHPEADYRELEAKFPAFVEKYLFEGRDYSELEAKGNRWEYYLQPLGDIHLTSNIAGEFEANGNKNYIRIFLFAGIFILAMACINFMNLSTAKSVKRAREVGIKKVAGATKTILIGQFLAESVVITLVSLLTAICIAEILMPGYSALTGRDLAFPYHNPLTIIALVLFAIILGIVAGSYPAFVLSSFVPVKVLKGTVLRNGRGPGLRNILVLVQFSISVFLVAGTIIAYRQLQLIQNKDLGFNKENILVIQNAYLLGNASEAFKNELRKAPTVIAVAGSNRMPGMRFNNIGFGAEGLDDGFTLNLCCCDPEYADALSLHIVNGRFFSKEFGTDTAAIVLNEAAVKLIGWEDPIGKKVNNWNNPRDYFTVIGIAKDIHYESMHEKVRPQAFLYLDGIYGWPESFIAVRFKKGLMKETVAAMEKIWDDFSLKYPLTWSLFEKDYDDIYINEAQTKNMMLVFSILAVFIACLGLTGLASFNTVQRTRETGIRKSMGASTGRIIVFFTMDFLKWVLAATLLACPLAWLAGKRWLEDFEYRTNLHWWIFVASSILTLLIAFLITGYHSFRAARTNPVDALRYE